MGSVPWDGVCALGWGSVPWDGVCELGWGLCPGMGPVPLDGVCALGWRSVNWDGGLCAGSLCAGMGGSELELGGSELGLGALSWVEMGLQHLHEAPLPHLTSIDSFSLQNEVGEFS